MGEYFSTYLFEYFVRLFYAYEQANRQTDSRKTSAWKIFSVRTHTDVCMKVYQIHERSGVLSGTALLWGVINKYSHVSRTYTRR